LQSCFILRTAQRSKSGEENSCDDEKTAGKSRKIKMAESKHITLKCKKEK
jgi:hypothetical protein